MCSRVTHGKRQWLTNGFSTTISSDLTPGPWSKQPSARHTASPYTTARHCYSVTIFHSCSASTVDDPATSDSLPRSDVLPRCVWRATSGSASDGYRAISTAVTGAAREHDSAHDVDHLGSNDRQTFPVSHTWLSREFGSREYKASAASDGVAIEWIIFPEAHCAVAEETENFLRNQAGRRRERRARTDPTSSPQGTTRIEPLHEAPSTHSAQGDARWTGPAVS